MSVTESKWNKGHRGGGSERYYNIYYRRENKLREIEKENSSIFPGGKILLH